MKQAFNLILAALVVSLILPVRSSFLTVKRSDIVANYPFAGDVVLNHCPPGLVHLSKSGHIEGHRVYIGTEAAATIWASNPDETIVHRLHTVWGYVVYAR